MGPKVRYEFQSHSLDPQRRELQRRGRQVPLARKPFAVLLHLLDNRDRLVTKAELLDCFWPAAISDGVLQSTIRQIRRALGDDGRTQRVIRTYHGEGFRFVAAVTTAPAATPAPGRSAGRRASAAPSRGMAEAAGATPAPPPTPNPMPAPAPPEATPAAFEERRLSAVLVGRATVGPAARSMPEGTDAVGAFLAEASRLAERHGGLVLHVLPDGFTAVFGGALGVEKGSVRAYDCARELARSAVARTLERTGGTVRFGLDAGRFPAVAQPDDARVRALSTRVLRSALALAEAAGSGCAAVSDRAASHLGPAARRRRSATGELPLRHAPPAEAVQSPVADAGFRRFVGRQSEMAFLDDRLDRVLRGHGEMAVLAGEAGIGKSRLLAEFLTRAEERGCRCLKLLTDPRERNTPLAVMAAAARGIAAALGPTDAATVPVDMVDAALWRDLLGGEGEAAALAALTPHMRRRRTFRVLRARLERLAALGPVVLAIEDIHWLDATSRDGLDYLGQTLAGVAVLLVVTTRPVPEMRLLAPVTTLRLPPLEPSDGLHLLQSRLGAGRLRPDEARALVGRAGGNPFFLEQLLVAVEGGADPLGGLPDTVQEVIAVRISRLSAEARMLLLATAAIGPDAPAEVMAGAVGWSADTFETVLSELLAAGVLEEDPQQAARSVRFRHILWQNVAHAMLGPEDRRGLHRRIAQLLTAAGTPAPPERLAWHHQEAGDTLAAVAAWTRAARAAQHRSASREAVAFARKGLRLLGRDGATGAAPPAAPLHEPARELDLQLTLAPALAATMGYGSDEVGVAYRRARDLSRTVGTPRSEFRMLVGLWNYDWVRGDLARAHGHAGELLALADRTGDATMRLRAQACMGEILFHMGALPDAARYLHDACRLFADSAEVRAATRVPAVACHCYAAWASSFLGRSTAALEFCAMAGAIADELVQPFSMSLHLALKAELLLFEGDVAGCLDTAREAAAISLREGFPFWHGTALVNLGWAEAHAGDPARGLARLREGIAVFEGTGARVQLANWYGLLAEVLLLAGDRPAARTAADTAAGWARRTGDVFFLPRIERTRAALRKVS